MGRFNWGQKIKCAKSVGFSSIRTTGLKEGRAPHRKAPGKLARSKLLDDARAILSLKNIMADKSDKSEKNVPGKFYVDRQCIDCGLCQETAPAVFARDDDGGCAYVSKQPADADELAAAKEAMDSCPVQAIGDDGE